MRHHSVSAYAPELRGWYERGHKDLNLQTRCFLDGVTEDAKDWVSAGRKAAFVMNSTPYVSSSPLRPSDLNRGGEFRSPTLPLADDIIDARYTDDFFSGMDGLERRRLETQVQEMFEDRQMTLLQYTRTWELLREKVRQELSRRGKNYRTEFSVGDLVMTYRPPSSKLSSRWSGPGTIEEIHGSTEVTIRDVDNGLSSIEYISNLKKVNSGDCEAKEIVDTPPRTFLEGLEKLRRSKYTPPECSE